MSFLEYYKQQFRDIPTVWRLAKKHKKYFAFFATVIQLLNIGVIHTMYLYDTGKIKPDERFLEK